MKWKCEGMAGNLGDSSASTIRGLIWALGRDCHIKDRPEACKAKGKKCLLEIKLLSAYKQWEKVLIFLDFHEKVNEFNLHSNNDKVPWKNGTYSKVFAKGIRDIKMSFSDNLMEIERSLLLDPTGISTDSLATAETMRETYLLINRILQQICEEKLSGCQILDLCQKVILMTQVTTTIEKLKIVINCLHREMLDQIKDWVLYGELKDSYSEFFIKQTDLSVEPPLPRRMSLHHRGSLDTSVCSVSGEFCASLIESTTASLPFTKRNPEQLITDLDKYYEIDPSFVPSYLPYSLVYKIFSLGKFIIQIKHNPSNKVPVNLMTVNLSDYGIDESEVNCMFKQLRDVSSFHHHLLENHIDFIWGQMNRYMKKLAEEEGDLMFHHRNITDVYLMGRGELFRYFIDEASHLLLSDANKVYTRSLDIALERVAEDLYGTNHVQFLKRFHFYLPPRSNSLSGHSALSVMKLMYKSPWPLPLIYSRVVLETYNTVFIFLLNLKRAHRELTIAWNDMSAISQEKLKRRANELHLRLTSLITNLQSYVFVDVIMSETDSFWKVLKESGHFEEIQMAHAKFLSNIIMRLFLPIDNKICDKTDPNVENKSAEFQVSVGLVHKELIELFSLTFEFSTTVKLMASIPEEGLIKLDGLYEKFDSLIVALISLVKMINERFCSEHLRTLIMRLDYNGYYMKQYDI